MNKCGSKTFQLRLRRGTATSWITLGRFPEMSLRDARMQATWMHVCEYGTAEPGIRSSVCTVPQ
ncbi:Arm DNA-binding domain-containing protein [Thalassorhabdomicrobium marinisediminis]|uniref:Arm DNA-binding domain-containing protein n=1 Tax=Thalassorhabdomicrobium marinisediminis TaxID=2170577 RepID=UPI003CD0D8A1